MFIQIMGIKIELFKIWKQKWDKWWYLDQKSIITLDNWSQYLVQVRKISYKCVLRQYTSIHNGWPNTIN